MKTVVIMNYSRYPNGDAGAIRDHAFAKMYSDLGYNVIVVGMGPHTSFSVKENDKIPYVSLRTSKSNIFFRISNFFGYKSRLKKFLKTVDNVSFLHVGYVPSNALFFIKRLAKRNNAVLVHDSVEWFSPEQFKFGRASIRYSSNNKLNTRWIDNNFRVISISSFLNNHFLSRGIKSVRISVIMDIAKTPFEKCTVPEKIVFLYAGSPGKKDYLSEIVKGFSLLTEEELKKCELRILGVTQQQLITLCDADFDDIEKIGESLKCLGRVPRDEVMVQLQRADFTVLLRSERQRYAKAGFPTKVVESLAAATPVVTNLTSDLGQYLEDGRNSVLVAGCSPKAFAEALQKAINIDGSKRVEMQNAARNTAETEFDYRKYLNDMNEFLK